MAGQLSLFDASDPGPRSSGRPRPDADPRDSVGPAIVPPDLVELAARLPSDVHLGTSSWSFPGWAGIVYDQSASEAALARVGLTAYSRHPLLRAVGIDRTYYAPITAAQFAAYATQTPALFRFLVKAHELCTLPRINTRNRSISIVGGPNPQFLDPAYAVDQVVAPAVDGLGPKLGPILFQFPPLPLRRHRDDAGALLDRLAAFLAALPRGPLYAVELRNAELLTPQYVAALQIASAVHCFNVHPRMHAIAEQSARIGHVFDRALVVRWMLGGDQDYDQARERYAPFDKLVDEDQSSRDAIAALAVRAIASQTPVYTIANNKAEGSAPRTIFKLAERICRHGDL